MLADVATTPGAAPTPSPPRGRAGAKAGESSRAAVFDEESGGGATATVGAAEATAVTGRVGDGSAASPHCSGINGFSADVDDAAATRASSDDPTNDARGTWPETLLWGAVSRIVNVKGCGGGGRVTEQQPTQVLSRFAWQGKVDDEVIATASLPQKKCFPTQVLVSDESWSGVRRAPNEEKGLTETEIEGERD